MEKVSIIVPVYNVENYVEKCICSIISQTYKNIEIIIINDGSTDNSKQICEKYASKDNRIKFFNKENEGLATTRNYGIEKASGEFILFVDSDDYIEKDAVEILLAKIKEKNLDVVIGNAIVEGSKKIKPYLIRKKSENEKVMSGIEYLIERNKKDYFCVCVWISMYKKQFILQNNLFFKDGILHEDEEWTPRVMLKANRVEDINLEFYHYIKYREDSILNNKNKTQNMIDLFNIFKSLKEVFNQANINQKQHLEMLDYLCRRIY